MDMSEYSTQFKHPKQEAILETNLKDGLSVLVDWDKKMEKAEEVCGTYHLLK